MPARHHLRLPPDAAFWPALARAVDAWWGPHAPAWRDTVVVVPYAELLPLARAAFAGIGGWQPRIETTRTLAASLAPPLPRSAAAPSLDIDVDRLSARALLQSMAPLASWSARDPRGFDRAAAAVAAAAQALATAVAAVEPAGRRSWWQRARSVLAPVDGPGATERMLARVALEWAAVDDAMATDRLFDHRPAAWVIVHAGGVDALAGAVAAQAGAVGVPVLEVTTDAAPNAPFEGFGDLAAPPPPPRRLRCAGFEDEAEAAAAEVLRAVGGGRSPVALVALDRALVRRVHALLERTPGLRVDDETGWRMSTTRAAARVMAALRAADASSTADERLDWLKADARWPRHAVDAIERAWREGRAPARELAESWAAERRRLAPLADGAARSLSQWLQSLREALGPPGDDAAAVQLAATLRLGDRDAGEPWRAAAGAARLDRNGFIAWVDAVLDAATYRPPPPADPHVVVTPLARCLLRPFAAVVCPGTDDRQLGAATVDLQLFDDATLAAIGLPTREQRRQREAAAFAQLLQRSRVTLLRRTSDDGEPRSMSPLVERAQRASERAGARWPQEEAAAIVTVDVAAQPLARPAPVVRSALPQRLSATTVESLRDCPYRFFALAVLRLRQPEELDDEVEKSDYGRWLHQLLHRFHAEREAPRSADADGAELLRLADAVQTALDLDPARLWPFRAAFEPLVPRYVAWWHRREAAGWGWQAGEVEHRRPADGTLPVMLHGRIDRIDAGPDGVWQLIDYKTSAAEGLRRKVRQPLEDTQLAVYAALVASAQPEPRLQAMYLALDAAEAPLEVDHEDVGRSAAALVEGLGADWRELQAGTGLTALGEGRVCERCEVRGLCRRDHWGAEPARDRD